MAKKKFQWHPLFAQLLRPRLEGHFDIRTSLPVGDLPRLADIVLLQRAGSGAVPFHGLWRWLTTWSVLEYKGPTVQPRERDLPDLVELGLGISRRLNSERMRHGERALPDHEVSFWYIVNSLSPRYLDRAERCLGKIETVAPGIWRAVVVRHPCLLVSTADLAVDDDSIPLHVLGIETPAKEHEIGLFVIDKPARLEAYGGVFSVLHPEVWEELKIMARSRRPKFEFDLRPAVDFMGLPGVIKQIGEKKIIEQLGTKRVLQQLDVEDILADLPPAKRRELQRRLEGRPPTSR